MSLFARAEGAGAETLVFLHGFGGTHHVWNDIAPVLAQSATVLRYDLPGHGGSLNYLDAGAPKVAAQAVLVDLAKRNVSRAHFIGHSMGGAIASLIAILQPQVVASLTLLSPGGFGPDINHRLLTRYAAARERAQLEPCLEAMYGWYSTVPETAIADALQARAVPGQVEMLERMAAGMVRDGKQGQLPLERLASLDAKVRLLWGGLDNVLPFRQTSDLPAQFEVRALPDIGHMLPHEARDQVIALVYDAIRL